MRLTIVTPPLGMQVLHASEEGRQAAFVRWRLEARIKRKLKTLESHEKCTKGKEIKIPNTKRKTQRKNKKTKKQRTQKETTTTTNKTETNQQNNETKQKTHNRKRRGGEGKSHKCT